MGNLVFTNGCFDILHAGHIKLFKFIKSYFVEPILCVGLNSDESTKRIKGNNRPYNNVRDRIMVLESIKYVDIVIVFNEDTPYNLIKQIKPNFIVKGPEYKEKYVVGQNLTNVVFADDEKVNSTTNLLNKISNE